MDAKTDQIKEEIPASRKLGESDAKEIAKGFDVTGWVKNLDDGRVEMLVRGEEEVEVDSFIKEITENSHLANFIREVDVEVTNSSLLDKVRGFVIEG